MPPVRWRPRFTFAPSHCKKQLTEWQTDPKVTSCPAKPEAIALRRLPRRCECWHQGKPWSEVAGQNQVAEDCSVLTLLSQGVLALSSSQHGLLLQQGRWFARAVHLRK